MAESYSFGETIGTSDDGIPDFAALLIGCKDSKNIVQENVAEQEVVSACKTSEKFYDIIISLGFRPILMEIAVIHDRRLLVERRQLHNTPPTPFFVSSIISFRDSQRNAPFLKAWDSSLKRILHPNDEVKPIVPHPETYQMAYFVEPLNASVQWVREQLLTRNRPQKRAQVPKSPEAFVATQADLRNRVADLDQGFVDLRRSNYSLKAGRAFNIPAVHQTRYSYEPITDNAPAVTKSIASLAAGFVWSLIDEISSTEAPESLHTVLDSLEYTHLLVVPFRRPIVTSTASLETDSARIKGDEPGGCLFVVVEPRLTQAAPPQKLEDLALRLSWILFRAALREAHAEIEIRRSQADALPVVSHFLPTEIATAKSATSKLRESLQQLPIDQQVAMSHVNTVEALLKRLDGVASFAIKAWKVTEGIAQPGKPSVAVKLESFSGFLLTQCQQFWTVLREVRERFLQVPAPFIIDHEGLDEVIVRYEPEHVSVIANELVNNIIKHAEEPSGNQFLIRIALRTSADGRYLHMLVANPASASKIAAAQTMIRDGGKVGLRTMSFANSFYSLPAPSFQPDESQGLFISDIPVGEVSSGG